ncbi:hypothetical protein GGQ87_002288 [Brevundimonas alba]|uniref:Uncharacterized protein n=1 Tax=Brevundimonas alba TaxID=74314 RepID=A0A7X6BNB5_9CAUL|nr:hypothetical protein [Brevundimonas alba]NJC41993.1 hypothetical protein [Brevundimonas alba]
MLPALLTSLQAIILTLVPGSEIESRVSGMRRDEPRVVDMDEAFYPGGAYVKSGRVALNGRWWAEDGRLCTRLVYAQSETWCRVIAKDEHGRLFAAGSVGDLNAGRVAEIRFVPIED